jgi:hypothetical protein
LSTLVTFCGGMSLAALLNAAVLDAAAAVKLVAGGSKLHVVRTRELRHRNAG